MRLLMVEDDTGVAETLAAFLRRQGYVVDGAGSLGTAQEALLSGQFDLVIVDRTLPDGDGMELVLGAKAGLRPQRFLMLTAMSGVEDTVAALEAGAIDYVVKPFEPRELLARIRNALRRELNVRHEPKRFGPLSYDADSNSFTIDDEPFVLRRTESLVLAALIARPGAMVPRETLEARVYGYDRFVNANSLESQISRLRRNIAGRTDRVKIQTVRGVGYCLSES
ncbi:response regulator transcription factor [Sphingomonas sp. Leaf62]|uniref:response regulator transcription factor n=1 Tax=Sphingomonas sp. Leaf62 TaxID=1736228 RepID=UPI0006F364C5|nr:response regulator transcription factor [Sphingomonas sp. Leaf62]KQN79755.1 two-component system response regulator [Sphingomonas sp. Leaf62]